MKITEYSNIAKKYDNNKFRHNIEHDNDLEEYINNSIKSNCTVLDLACGTGIYLSNQIRFFDKFNIEWHGIDASIDMLNIAKTKVKNVIFKNNRAEELNYQSSYFDFICNNYAFHHFEGKEKALNEISRVIKKNGVFKLHNIAIHEMKEWWIYKLFPTAYYEDLKRFWTKEVIFNELIQRDFKVKMHINYKMETIKLANFMDYIYNRDISILTLISDEEYNKGIEMVEFKLKKDSEAEIISDFAEIFFIASKY